jgi:glucosamine 6-phosphate synthetase-like amidotransferase/phosphosugar isomerase protein
MTISIPSGSVYTSPIIYNIALQILAYHVAVLKGSDIDQPRNLAKSVTVGIISNACHLAILKHTFASKLQS